MSTQAETTARRERKRKHKLILMEYLGGACVDCGCTLEDYKQEAFDIDHGKREKKTMNFGTCMGHSVAKLKKEIDMCECELVCSNCHRTRTRKLRLSPEFETKERKELHAKRTKNLGATFHTNKVNGAISKDGWVYRIKQVRRDKKNTETFAQRELSEFDNDDSFK